MAGVRLAPLLARVLGRRGTNGFVFRGDDGLDELSVTTTSKVWSVSDGQVRAERLDPRDLGLAPASADALRGGDRVHNARVCHEVLAGAHGPVRDAVLLSAAAGLAALEPAAGRSTTPRLAAGLERAAESVDSGAAAAVLEHWAAVITKRARAATG